MILASQDHDPSKTNVLSINFSDTTPTSSKEGKRYRLIPKHDGRESKLGYPVIYLGLSRLYP